MGKTFFVETDGAGGDQAIPKDPPLHDISLQSDAGDGFLGQTNDAVRVITVFVVFVLVPDVRFVQLFVICVVFAVIAVARFVAVAGRSRTTTGEEQQSQGKAGGKCRTA